MLIHTVNISLQVRGGSAALSPCPGQRAAVSCVRSRDAWYCSAGPTTKEKKNLKNPYGRPHFTPNR